MISIVNQVINHFLQSTENQQYNYFNVILISRTQGYLQGNYIL